MRACFRALRVLLFARAFNSTSPRATGKWTPYLIWRVGGRRSAFRGTSHVPVRAFRRLLGEACFLTERLSRSGHTRSLGVWRLRYVSCKFTTFNSRPNCTPASFCKCSAGSTFFFFESAGVHVNCNILITVPKSQSLRAEVLQAALSHCFVSWDSEPVSQICLFPMAKHLW